MFKVPNQYRIRSGPLGSKDSIGKSGAFEIPSPIDGALLGVIASDYGGWDHVSVSRKNRCPNWPEMCFVKDLFWTEDECIMQFHPPKSVYVNHHPNVLHMWRDQSREARLPPLILV